jgi:3'-phosphoadenosine 5'-phosphosulfate sulfotransferase (PAPS reductase)/FAD synthetase
MMPTVDWTDDELRQYANQYGLPVVHIPLAMALLQDAPDTAEVDFRHSPSLDRATVRRYKSHLTSALESKND